MKENSKNTKKKVVMLLTNAFDPDVRVYKEAVYLISKRMDVTILCWDRYHASSLPKKEKIDGIKVIRFNIESVAGSGAKQIPAFLKYISCCRKWLKKHKPDFYHCNDIDGTITWYLSKSNRAPMVFDMHEFYEDYEPKTSLSVFIYRLMTRFFIKRSFYSLYENNLYLKDNYRSVYDKLVPLKNYPDTNLVQCVPKTESEVFRIGYHGAVRGQIKEFATLFEAVKGMPDVRVNVHGGGPDLEELKELEKNYENVTIHGPFDGTKELTNLYANSDIVFAGYTQVSKSCECDEMVKFFECIVTGTPMILTNTYKLMAKQIDEGGFGIACDTDSIEEVKKAIFKLKTDRAFWKKCADNEKKAAYKYEWNNAVKILDKVYEIS